MVDANFLKLNDPDRYLLSLFVSNGAQRLVVAAFDELNIEIARLRDTIDTPHMGFIRLQWWKDEIKKIYAGEKFAPHQVLQDLAGALLPYQISPEDVHQLIIAREADFEEYDSFDIYAYARNIHAPLLKIKAKILGEAQSTDALAEGFALIGLLRAIPFYRARSQVLVPSIQPDAVRKICDRAEELLDMNTASHRYFKAHVVLARLYLKQIISTGYQPEKLTPLPFKELRVWWGL
jgi:phytoene/squalene synthetase